MIAGCSKPRGFVVNISTSRIEVDLNLRILDEFRPHRARGASRLQADDQDEREGQEYGRRD